MPAVGYPVTQVFAPPTSIEVPARLELGKEWMRNFFNLAVRKNRTLPHDSVPCAAITQTA
jgi:hypothetical protein